MAEIHVEKKRGPGALLWVVLLVVLVIAAAIYLWQAGYIQLSQGMGMGTGMGMGGTGIGMIAGGIHGA